MKHNLVTLVRQRLFAIAQGYEDANDAGALASQPTISWFENRADPKDRRRLWDWLLDLGETFDPAHGKHQRSFFHGYGKEHL